MNYKVVPILLLLSINNFAYADEEHEHRQHSAHVHGEAKLNILIDETTIAFELETPANNVLGFEHKPKTAEEKNKAEEAAGILSVYTGVLAIPEVNCEQLQADLDFPFHNEKMHHDQGHDHHHEDHDEHGDHDEHEGHDEHDEHSEYHLSYSLKCENIDNIKTIEVKLFDNFAGFENVDTKWISQNSSGGAKVTKEQKVITIK